MNESVCPTTCPTLKTKSGSSYLASFLPLFNLLSLLESIHPPVPISGMIGVTPSYVWYGGSARLDNPKEELDKVSGDSFLSENRFTGNIWQEQSLAVGGNSLLMSHSGITLSIKNQSEPFPVFSLSNSFHYWRCKSSVQVLRRFDQSPQGVSVARFSRSCSIRRKRVQSSGSLKALI